VLILLYSGLVVSNVRHLNSAYTQDQKTREGLEDVKVINYIQEHYPDRKIYIAGFKTLALSRAYYFMEPGREILADYHRNLIYSFNPDEEYVYIILFPNEFNALFKALDPNAVLITDLSSKYSLLVSPSN